MHVSTSNTHKGIPGPGMGPGVVSIAGAGSSPGYTAEQTGKCKGTDRLAMTVS